MSELVFACSILSPGGLSASHPTFRYIGKDTEDSYPLSASCPGQHRVALFSSFENMHLLAPKSFHFLLVSLLELFLLAVSCQPTEVPR